VDDKDKGKSESSALPWVLGGAGVLGSLGLLVKMNSDARASAAREAKVRDDAARNEAELRAQLAQRQPSTPPQSQGGGQSQGQQQTGAGDLGALIGGIFNFAAPLLGF